VAVHSVPGLLHSAPADLWTLRAEGPSQNGQSVSFGVSALDTAPLAQALIEAYGILRTFFILGIAFLALLVLMSLILRFPAVGWRPEGWQGAADEAPE